MTTYDAPDPSSTNDPARVAALVAALRAGETLPPVVVLDNGTTAVTGTHRLAAYREAEMDPAVIILTAAQCEAAADHLGIDSLADADPADACMALERTCDDPAVVAAVRDQW